MNIVSIITLISLLFGNTLCCSGTVKLVVIGHNDTAFSKTVDDITLFIAKNHSKSVQVYNHNAGDACEFIGGVDRAKLPSDFILVVKKKNDTKLKCDIEWGRQSFAIMKFWPDKHHSNKSDVHFKAKITFQSTEMDTPNWLNVTSGSTLLNFLLPHFLPSQSRIPDDYPFRAEREQRVKQRTLKAVCALMALAIISLLVILFLGSLSRYNDAQKKRHEEEQRLKKKQDQALAPPPPKKPSESTEKSEKSVKKTEKASDKKED